MSIQSKCLHLLVGTSKSGKSYLLRYMLRSMLSARLFKFGLVFTATKFNGGYDWLPDKYVYVDFDMDVLLAYMNFLVRIKIPPSFIVFDDIISSLPLGTRLWSQFMATFRHYNITLFISTQYVNMADALMRSQTDYAYLFQMHSDAQFKSTYATFGTMLVGWVWCCIGCSSRSIYCSSAIC
jgi:hypothetical protein